jgi:hypothetical protein
MDVILHFDGLRPGTHTWFYNCRGAQVRIDPGSWVIVDTTANPFWKTSWVDTGIAHQEAAVPNGVDFLHENSNPERPNIPPPWGDGEPPRGAFALYGPISDPEWVVMSDGKPCSVLDLTPDAIERIRLCYMPVELPGIALVDARRDKRGGKSAHTLPPPFELNFFVLIRLAWLQCRELVEAEIRKAQQEWAQYQEEVQDLDLPEDPVRRVGRGEIRRRIKDATANVLASWGVLRGDRLPNRVTVYRDMKAALLTVDAIDRVILGRWKSLVDSDEASRKVQPQASSPEAQ